MNNREIKFRVWDKRKKKFVERPRRFQQHKWGLSYFGGTSEYLQKNCYVLQQYTGLKDINNKEIYEGDIVKTDNREKHMCLLLSNEHDVPNYTHGEITWWNYCFAICQKGVGAVELYEYASCDCHPCSLEIIGNIFEDK